VVNLNQLVPAGVAIALAVAFASLAAFHLTSSYSRRDRGLRFRTVCSIFLLVLVWVVVVAVTFFFLYYPESVWRT
jgi:lipopolysaccharide export LptBFGC system permease protein LptF